MSNLIVYLLVTFGFCACVSTAKPLKSFREFVTKKSLMIGKFLSCPSCMSIWVSPFVFYWVYKLISLDMIPFSFLAFGVVYILESFKSKCS